MVALELWLRLASLLSLLGALLGAYGLIAPRGIAQFFGLSLGPDAAPFTAVRAVFGGVLLMHAASFTALAQAPRIGSCIAAAAGAAWLGQSAGRAVAVLLVKGQSRHQISLLLVEGLVGMALWAPLWTYLKLIREGLGT